MPHRLLGDRDFARRAAWSVAPGNPWVWRYQSAGGSDDPTRIGTSSPMITRVLATLGACPGPRVRRMPVDAMTTESVAHLTELLRSDDSPFWSRSRECLRERGIDPSTCLLVQSFELDVDQELGILLTEEHRVVEFNLDYHVTGDPKDALVSAWVDFTGTWRESPFAREVTAGFQVLNEGRPE